MRGLILGLLAFIVIFVAGFLALGEFVYDYSFGVHRFPIIIGLVTIALAIAAGLRLLAVDRPARVGPSKGSEAQATADEGSVHRAWPPGTTRALLWLVAALPVMILCGYVAGAAVYLLAYLKWHGERWVTAVAFAAVAAIVVYFGFHEFLGVQLPVTPFWWPE